MILFTGQDPDPFWAEAIVSVGDPGDNAVWRASSSLALRRKSDGRSNLLAPSAVAESDTLQDSRALMASRMPSGKFPGGGMPRQFACYGRHRILL